MSLAEFVESVVAAVAVQTLVLGVGVVVTVVDLLSGFGDRRWGFS